MAETVGQHSVAAFTSPVNGTTPIDANSVRGNDNTVRSAYVDHDADPGIHVQSSTLASRPAAGTAGRKWVTVSSGRYQFWYDDGSRWHEVASDAVNVDCLADANLAKGDVIKITGFNNGQNLPTVNKVTSSTDVAFGIVENTVTSGNIVQIVNTGLIEDVDTNGYAVGTILYPNSSGGWTTTKPTSGNYQPAGFVLRGNTNNGVLYVEFSAPRIVERSNNEASTIVLRDASGNFAAGTITAGAVTSTGLVTFASLKGTGATTVTNILDEDNMASDSATALATQQSIKAYVDTKVATVDTLAEVLANGNTTGATDIIVTAGQKITTDTIAETTAAAGVTIDSVLLKDDVVNATDIEVDTISANNGTLAVTLASTGVATIAQQPILSSLTASQAVFTDASKGLVSNAITGTGNVVMSASPTLTGTVTAATINATTLGGTLSTAAQPNVTSVGTLSSLTVSGATKFSSTVAMNGLTAGAWASPLASVIEGGAAGVASSSLIFQTNASGISMNANYFYDGVEKFKLTGDAAQINNTGTAISFKTASGSAGGTISWTNAMVITNAGRVGIGTASPSYELHALGNVNGSVTVASNNTSAGASAFSRFLALADAGNAQFGMTSSAYTDISGAQDAMLLNANSATGGIAFALDGVLKMKLDASGNLGLGVTPSAWASTARAMQIDNLTLVERNSSESYIGHNFFYNSSDATRYVSNGYSSRMGFYQGSVFWDTATSGNANDPISFTQAMTLDASGNLLVGLTTGAKFSVSYGGNDTHFGLGANYDNYISAGSSGVTIFRNGSTERVRITSGGDFGVAKTASNINVKGTFIGSDGGIEVVRDSNTVLFVSRLTNDGALVSFYQGGTEEGTISVSGATVSYNAFAGSHWSQLEDGSKPDILRGTVMEALNDLCEWPGEQNERLPKCKVSDTAGSKKVYGVFMDWDNDWTETNDMYVTAVGAFVCRINSGVVVAQGDLLESNGDGTARVQADDVIRSSTIGKVTSTVQTHQYEDGTYCVPVVLYCG